MQDYVVRSTAAGGLIRAMAARTTLLVDEARRRHHTYPTATAALGRVLTAAAIMSVDLGENHTITIRVLGDGPLGGIVAVAEAGGRVRGYVQEPATHLQPRPDGKLDVGAAVGKGTLTIAKDLGLKEPYTGTVPLVSGEIAEDLTSYFYISEQIPSVVSLGVLVDVDNSARAAGGYFLQLMPGAGNQLVDLLERNVQEMPAVSSLVDQGREPEEILEMVLSGTGVKLYQRFPVSFTCTCTRERLERALISLGKDELESILVEQGEAELSCHFCSQVYHFGEKDLRRLLSQVKR